MDLIQRLSTAAPQTVIVIARVATANNPPQLEAG